MLILLLRLFINALALLLVSQIVPGIMVASPYSALVAALVLGIVNAIIRPIILLLTLPINLLTLGLFTLVVNALMLLLVSTVVKGFFVEGFAAALWGSLLLWLVSWITNGWLQSKNKDASRHF